MRRKHDAVIETEVGKAVAAAVPAERRSGNGPRADLIKSARRRRDQRARGKAVAKATVFR
jgi:hypothetical protein